MSYWLELHCDIRSEGPADYVPVDPFCLSDRGANPGVLVDNRRSSVTDAWRTLRNDAIDSGWYWDGNQWMCPNCHKLLGVEGKE